MHDQNTPSRAQHYLTRSIDVLIVTALMLVILNTACDLALSYLLTDCTVG